MDNVNTFGCWVFMVMMMLWGSPGSYFRTLDVQRNRLVGKELTELLHTVRSQIMTIFWINFHVCWLARAAARASKYSTTRTKMSAERALGEQTNEHAFLLSVEEESTLALLHYSRSIE